MVVSTNRLSLASVEATRKPDNLFMAHWRDVNLILASLGSPEALFADICAAHDKHGIRDAHEAAHYVRAVRGEE